MKKPAQSIQEAWKSLSELNFRPELKGAEMKMTDKPLPWPHNAANARDRSAEEMQHIVLLLTPMLEGLFDQEEIKTRISMALVSTHIALRHLEGQGAPTRPD